jgi:hypothetical protein
MRNRSILLVFIAAAALALSCEKRFPEETNVNSVAFVEQIHVALMDSLIHTDSIIMQFYDVNQTETVRLKFLVDYTSSSTASGTASFYSYTNDTYISGPALLYVEAYDNDLVLGLLMESIRDYVNTTTDQWSTVYTNPVMYIEEGSTGMEILHNNNYITDIHGQAYIHEDYDTVMGAIATANFDLFYP